MRIIKLRFWNTGTKAMGYTFNEPISIGDLSEGLPHFIWMLYTGYKDKNGKDIFEGDILRYVNYMNYDNPIAIGPVCWEDASFQIKGSFDEWLGEGYANEMEVIGNIYENPELIS